MTRVRPDVSLTTEIQDYSFTSAVSDRGHVECAPLLFAAVESHLSERQVSPQLIDGTFLEYCLVVMVIGDSTTQEASLLKGRKHLFHHGDVITDK